MAEDITQAIGLVHLYFAAGRYFIKRHLGVPVRELSAPLVIRTTQPASGVPDVLTQLTLSIHYLGGNHVGGLLVSHASITDTLLTGKAKLHALLVSSNLSAHTEDVLVVVDNNIACLWFFRTQNKNIGLIVF